MYKKIKPSKTSINVSNAYIGESIEQKIDRMINNKEPIKDTAPQIYTDRKDGVIADYDIRTDRFDAALDVTDAIAKANKARRDNTIAKRAQEGMAKEAKTETKNDGGPEPIPGK